MEKGFYHPQRGYWQVTSNPSQDILSSYPEGTIEVPLKPSSFHEWSGSNWVKNASLENESLATQARAQRNSLLAASDWTQIPDAPVNAQAWATYRQELRDIPQQAGFPANINWPTAPE
jgi:hypothetical protein